METKRWWLSTVTGNQATGDGDGSPGGGKASRRGKQSAGDQQDPLIPETVVGKAQGRAPGPAWEALGPAAKSSDQTDDFLRRLKA